MKHKIYKYGDTELHVHNKRDAAAIIKGLVNDKFGFGQNKKVAELVKKIRRDWA